MDRYQRNRSFSRPYQSTCGMNGGQGARGESGRRRRGNENRFQETDSEMENARSEQPMGNAFSRSEVQESSGCRCHLPENNNETRVEPGSERNDVLDDLSLAMAYVPMQGRIRDTYELDDALRLGTIFPELCKPFCGCGKRGGGR